MGLAKRMQEEMWERGYGIPPDKYICVKCIKDASNGDYALIDVVTENLSSGECSYCGKTSSTDIAAPIESLIERVMQAVQLHYEDANESLPWDEGAFVGTTYTIDDILDSHLEIVGDVEQDIRQCISSSNDTTWSHIDPFGLQHDQVLRYSWDRFVKLVKHEKRFMFSSRSSEETNGFDELIDPSDILGEIGDAIIRLNLYTKLGSDKVIFHIRGHGHFDNLEELASPPTQFATQPNRMNPPGISMFYAALDSKVAELETLPETPSGLKYTIGQFTLKEDIILVDLSKIRHSVSFFDVKRLRDYLAESFLRGYVYEISKPVDRSLGYADIDYVPTQILTEYVRYGMNHPKKVSGIQYRSAKSMPHEIKTSLVLFMDHATSIEHLNLVDLEHKEHT